MDSGHLNEWIEDERRRAPSIKALSDEEFNRIWTMPKEQWPNLDTKTLRKFFATLRYNADEKYKLDVDSLYIGDRPISEVLGEIDQTSSS